MARVQLQDLINRALDRADMANNVGSSQFYSTANLTYLANAANARLYDILVDTYEDFHVKMVTLQLVSGQETYDFVRDWGLVDAFGNPSMYKVREMFLVYGTGANITRYKLRRFNTNELTLLNNSVITPTFAILPTLYYREVDTGIMFEPIPGAGSSVTGYQVQMWYIPQATPLVNLTDYLDYQVVYGWDEFIVNEMAINMKIREESDVSALMARQADFERRVQAAAANRDVSEPCRVTDMERTYQFPFAEYV